MLGLVQAIRTINRWIARALGIALLAMGALIIVEIALRRTIGGALGGSDEVSGYVMAGLATWGFAYALSERAHVRIDLVQRRLPSAVRAWFDVLALAVMTGIALLITGYGWRVLGTTLDRGSTANTPLETPLWIPQSVWFGGWVWFSVAAAVLLAAALTNTLGGRYATVEAIAGNGEGEDER